MVSFATIRETYVYPFCRIHFLSFRIESELAKLRNAGVSDQYFAACRATYPACRKRFWAQNTSDLITLTSYPGFMI